MRLSVGSILPARGGLERDELFILERVIFPNKRKITRCLSGPGPEDPRQALGSCLVRCFCLSSLKSAVQLESCFTLINSSQAPRTRALFFQRGMYVGVSSFSALPVGLMLSLFVLFGGERKSAFFDLLKGDCRFARFLEDKN